MTYPEFYTEAMIKESRKNHAKFIREYNVGKGYVLHHKDESLRYNDPFRYILWLPEDIEVMTVQEHSNYHLKKLGPINSKRMKGIPLTEEHKKNVSEGTKKAMARPEVKAKGCRIVRCIETGEVFPSVIEAQKKYPGHINQVCSGTRQTAAGYHWEYVFGQYEIVHKIGKEK